MKIVDMWRRWCVDEDMQARTQLIEHYGYVVNQNVNYMVRQCKAKGCFDDLMSVGYLALIKAVDKYNPTLCVKFETFATSTIQGYLKHYLRDNSELPRQSVEVRNKADKIASAIRLQTGADPTREQVAKHMGISPECLRRHEGTMSHGSPLSLSSPISEDGNGNCLVENLIDNRVDIQKSLEHSIQSGALSKALERLSACEQNILKLRFYKGLTRMEITEQVGISFRKVMRIEQSALARLRRMLDPVLFDAE